MRYQPDFTQFMKMLRRETPDRPVLYEFIIDGARVVQPAADAGLRRDGMSADSPAEDSAWANLGYDYRQTYGSDFHFPGGEHASKESFSLNEGCPISDRASFNAYPWPDPEAYDYSALARARPPAGMEYLIFGPGGVLENAIGLAGYDNLCYMMLDDPALAQDLFDAVGARLLRYYELSVPYPHVAVLVMNDDWGFKTSTMISPAQLRQYVIPWHKKMVEVAHAAGKPAILHSCGQLEEVMDDIIDVCGFDAKHSYEDTILPVEAAYARWGERICILGGIDVDFICRATPEAIKARAQALLTSTRCRGYALGSGNSITRYVPTENYLAMTSAALETREELSNY